MNWNVTRSMYVLGISVLMSGVICSAQTKKTEKSSKQTVELKTFKPSVVKAPRFSVSVSADRPSTELANEFLELRAEYSNRAEWLDELTFTYYLMLESRDAKATAGQQYSLWKGSVTYEDIEKGSRLASTMFLSPAKLKRYGKYKAIRVEITYQGQEIEAKTLPETPNPWWSAQEPKGRLLKRSETPFALIDSTYYPDIKDESSAR